MHRSCGLNGVPPIDPSLTVKWPLDSPTTEEWLATQPSDTWKETFTNNGFLVLKNIINHKEVEIYRDAYEKILSGQIDASMHRHDLGSHTDQKVKGKENICQVMWPSLYVNGFLEGPIHLRCLAISKIILGEDMIHDFDFIISKAAHTDTVTPWHCDESYWPDMPDKRAVSFWIAMDATCVDNGCMWFAPGSHLKPIRPHRPAGPGSHVLTCDGSEEEGEPQALEPGWGTCHSGRTMHYSRGNTTDNPRRGFVVSFRSEDMVRYEREHSFDHGFSGLNKIIGQHVSSNVEKE